MLSDRSSRSVVFAAGLKFNGVKVFSATMVAARERLGEDVTEWIAAHRSFVITEIVVTQSSDEQFHCVAISVFYRDETAANRR